MENNTSEAIRCNVLGTKILGDLAVDILVEKFVMISTDKAVNPTNVMGCSKRIAEIYVQSLNNHLLRGKKTFTSFVTTRFGNQRPCGSGVSFFGFDLTHVARRNFR